MKDLLSVEDIARHLAVHKQTVRRWVKSGDLKAYKVGQQIRVTPESLQKFKESRTVCIEYRPLPDSTETNVSSSLE